MFAIIAEIIACFMGIAGAVAKSEVGDQSEGEAKKQEAVAILQHELTDEGGITISNKYVLKALPMVLPFLIDVVVYLANRTGFFKKSKG